MRADPVMRIMAAAAVASGAVDIGCTCQALAEPCTVVVDAARTADTRCDRGLPQRVERRMIVDPADGRSRTTGTVVTY